MTIYSPPFGRVCLNSEIDAAAFTTKQLFLKSEMVGSWLVPGWLVGFWLVPGWFVGFWLVPGWFLVGSWWFLVGSWLVSGWSADWLWLLVG